MADEPADVTAAVLANAVILADFYKALRDQGIPEQLASELVADYHRECCLANDDDLG